MVPVHNCLDTAGSLYLRQHAGNPVHWQAWGEDALALAQGASKPVLLSIGYSACHWCHIMAEESFADFATAELINELFIPIKVDREERPDLDRLFLAAVARLGRPAGWPLTVFLTPEGVPYRGGGYYPPTAAFGLPAFKDVLRQSAAQYYDDPAAASRLGWSAISAIGAGRRTKGTIAITASLLDRTAHELARSIDWLYGGFGTEPPKFPHAGAHEILLRSWARSGNAALLDAALGSLEKMCDGAIYDHVGGGFHRYAVDDRWRVPHFEKMLCDNAVLASLLVKAWQASHAQVLKRRLVRLVEWLLRDMRLADGSFASSLASYPSSMDGAAHGGEGACYSWAPGELAAVLGERRNLFAAVYAEADEGPFTPRRTIYRNHGADDDEARVQPVLDELLAYRNRRGQAARDDKVLADWNGLMIGALADAGLALDRDDWIEAACRAFGAVRDVLANQAGLSHCAFEAAAGPAGFLDDYAAMAQAALSLYEATGDWDHVVQATQWVRTLDQDFWDTEAGGYFLEAAGPGVMQRQALIDETVAPSGNGMMLGVLSRLAVLTGVVWYRDRAEAIMRRFADRLTRASLSGATALNNSQALNLLTQIVIVGNPADPARAKLLRAATSCLVPDRLLVVSNVGTELLPNHPASGKTMLGGRSTAYVCVGVTCFAPTADPDELGMLLTKAARVG